MRSFLVCVAAAAVLLGGCAGPDQAMTEAGARAARDAASEVGTARVAVQAVAEGNLWSRAADRVVSDAETALGAVATAFGQQQPSTVRSRQTYDEITEALDDAEQAVVSARIAVRNDDRAALPKWLAELDRTAERLRSLGELAR